MKFNASLCACVHRSTVDTLTNTVYCSGYQKFAVTEFINKDIFSSRIQFWISCCEYFMLQMFEV